MDQEIQSDINIQGDQISGNSSESQTDSVKPNTFVQQPIEQVVQEPKIKSKFFQTFSDSWFKINPLLRKVLSVSGFLFGILLIFAIIYSVSTRPRVVTKSTPTPNLVNEEASLVPEVILNPSRYATDSAVLSVEEKLKAIEKNIDVTEINDLKLAQPNLLWDISFED